MAWTTYKYLIRLYINSMPSTGKPLIHVTIFIFFLILITVTSESYAYHEIAGSPRENKTFDTFTIYWENDFFVGTDRDYSNGLKLTWSTPYEIDNGENHLPEWSYPLINKLPFVDDPGTHRAVSISAGHMVFTPDDTSQTNVVVDDRPYAGYLYMASGFHNRSRNRKNSWELQFGLVGPLSFAEEAQDFFHDVLNSNKAEGWDNQLGNEVALEIICESQWRFSQANPQSSFNLDLIPHMGFRVGNVQIYANAGAELRYGWNLPKNFGSCPIRAGCATNSAFNDTQPVTPGRIFKGWHVFAAVDGRAVAHDIFLDGNTFSDSHSVDRKVFVADLMAGLAINFGKMRATYSYVMRTKQFNTETKNHRFGSINFSWSF